jgi:hypothetical protein
MDMKTMTTDSHCRGSKIIHNKGKKDDKTNGIKRMSKEEYVRDMDDINKRLNVIQMFLQENMKEN